ncbi:MAG: PadR family transcriptional regulator, partial [Acidimicrobiales bacterium]
MIDLAILGLLDEQDLHGYELKKQLAELVGARSGVSFGSLYPALARLEKGGAVKAVEAHTSDATIPMTGALSGEIAAFRARIGRPAKGRRTKKVYGITELGRQRLRELLLDDHADDRTFSVQVAFCQTLSCDERLALFERRKAELARRLAERSRATDSRTDTY